MIIPIVIITEDLYSQTSQVDSLEAILENLNEDTSRVNTLNELCGQLYRTDPEKTIRYGLEANNLAVQLDYQKGIARSFNLIGLGYYMQGNFVDAAINWEQSLELFMSLNDEKSIANILGNLGATYGQFGDDAKAIEYLLQSLQIAENLNDSSRIANCLLNIGAVYSSSLGDLDNAVNYYSKALTISESIDYLDAIGMIYFNLGEVFFQQAEYDSALFNFEKSLLIFESDLDKAASLNYIGKSYAEMEDYQTAIEFHNKALEPVLIGNKAT
jgi:tetratricopeptide (TPR) repeat protein